MISHPQEMHERIVGLPIGGESLWSRRPAGQPAGAAILGHRLSLGGVAAERHAPRILRLCHRSRPWPGLSHRPTADDANHGASALHAEQQRSECRRRSQSLPRPAPRFHAACADEHECRSRPGGRAGLASRQEDNACRQGLLPLTGRPRLPCSRAEQALRTPVEMLGIERKRGSRARSIPRDAARLIALGRRGETSPSWSMLRGAARGTMRRFATVSPGKRRRLTWWRATTRSTIELLVPESGRSRGGSRR